MGIAMGRKEMCYSNGERGYKFISAPYCTRHTGGKAPSKKCPGPIGLPYKGSIWSRGDPNTKGDHDLCKGFKIQNVCADSQTLCSTAAECIACKADGSMAVVSATSSKIMYRSSRSVCVRSVFADSSPSCLRAVQLS